jgi:hypothetical protein
MDSNQNEYIVLLTKYEESQPEERRSVSLIHQNSHFTQEKI